MDEKLQKITELTSACYSNLEKTEALITLLRKNSMGSKSIDITLEMAFSNIKNAEETILQIQNAMP